MTVAELIVELGKVDPGLEVSFLDYDGAEYPIVDAAHVIRSAYSGPNADPDGVDVPLMLLSCVPPAGAVVP